MLEVGIKPFMTSYVSIVGTYLKIMACLVIGDDVKPCKAFLSNIKEVILDTF
jgi:hypothetical protein